MTPETGTHDGEERRDIVIKVEGQTIFITPSGFVQYASEFLLAAECLPQRPHFSPVPYYLYGRALELLFKAFLLAKGKSKAELKAKPFGHDLVYALSESNTLGLASVVSVSAAEAAEIAKANEYYAGKGFEYFEVLPAVTGYPNLPDLSVLAVVALRLRDTLRPLCLAVA
jgi:hypothetical protein